MNGHDYVKLIELDEVLKKGFQSMSEDKTKILGDEEPTEELETEKAPTTNMMVETLFLEVREGFARVEKAIHSLERRFDVYTQDLIKMRGDVLNHENRLEDLERKAS